MWLISISISSYIGDLLLKNIMLMYILITYYNYEVIYTDTGVILLLLLILMIELLILILILILANNNPG